MDHVIGGLARTARAAARLVLPARCAGCGRAGHPWCGACRGAARRPPPPVPPLGSSMAPGAPRTWSATVLEGPVRAAVTAHKDGDRRDLRAVLAPLLASALVRALAEDDGLRTLRGRGSEVLVVPVPCSGAARRRRGGDPVAALAEAAATAVDPDALVLGDVLRHTRRVADQSGLGRAARGANLAGALAVRPGRRGLVDGAGCLLLDDVVTTGATLAEAARALRAAGARHVAAATVAATPHR
ncbi:ComF family protein [uncultured Phycicoccus sp.]|uniref:ComF family protein n=1 Tax=uncultured Phycicoccus sp. TaxID=661422 RepID=UPI0026236B56|nr:phosphoribosyltransferase family protein [uncultured Phycicoccus sp.]